MKRLLLATSLLLALLGLTAESAAVHPSTPSSREVFRVAVGHWPQPLVVNTATGKVYVGTFDGVAIVDPTTLNTTLVGPATQPSDLEVVPNTNRVFVANINLDTVTVIEGSTLVTKSVPTGVSPKAIGANPVTNKYYVANYGSNNVTVIDGETFTPHR